MPATPQQDHVSLADCLEADVSSEVSALLELLPSGTSRQWQKVESGLSNMLLQAHAEKAALQQRLTEW